ncbi:MAG: hypothetical protein IPP15_05145 [Saprospiraceae bacterium]|uniref:Uncharacterized protein n=1 Tax=Candidatus Opimibacter skivensis TaxID=2982028 RepID=A0A9D7SU58_9BACT|nr:hypothetical protein [Candidatus Opimibacter skivensis]
MEAKLQDDFEVKWVRGMKIAIERMILYKYRNFQSMVISTDEGIKIISGEDLLKYLPIEPKVGSDKIK